jgi:hypothetical protein
MRTEEQHKELCKLLENLTVGRSPIDFAVKISDLSFWSMNYKERKHLFVWATAATVITADDYTGTTTITIPATTWSIFAFPPGTKIQTSGSGTATTPLFFRATDEMVP